MAYCRRTPKASGEVACFLQYNGVKTIDLFLGEPMALIADFVGFDAGIGQHLVDVDEDVALLQQFDIGIEDTAVVEVGVGRKGCFSHDFSIQLVLYVIFSVAQI
jgi:hypothetical protein